MKRCLRKLAVLLPAATTVLAQPGPVPESLSSLEPRQAGEILARSLRSLAPAEDARVRGVLNIREGDRTRIVPLTLNIKIENALWKAIYETGATTNIAAEKLIIVHATNRPNDYLYASAARPGQPPAAPACLSREEAALPLAGSDFWLTDLGLEFLHWPKQRMLETAMRKSRVCHALESINPRPARGNYARVVSWVDKESGGIILAEAYDQQNRPLKEFSIGKVTKVEGQWQLQEMEIRNVQTKSRTRLEFHFEQPK
jgi:hypothetical protein